MSQEDSTGEYHRLYAPLSYYWRGVKTTLDMHLEYSAMLSDRFLPMSRVEPSFEDQFTETGDVREEYDEAEHFVGQA